MNASGKPSTVWLKGESPVIELAAAGAITPGHLVVRGTANTVTVQGSGVDHPMLVALENDIVGENIDAAYASGEIVSIAVAQSGDEFYCLLAPSATAVVVGSLLMSGAGGSVALRTTTLKAIAIALEAVDNSANAATSVRVKVQAI